MYEKVLKYLKDGYIIGVDFTGVDEFLDKDCERRVHIWVYHNNHSFLPLLAYEASLPEKEVITLFDSVKDLWIHDDNNFNSGVKIRYVSAVEPCGHGFLK